MGGKPFYGWYVAASSFLTLAFTVGIPLYGMPFYYDYFIEEYGWSRGATTGGMAFATLLVLPVAGFVVHRFSARKLILFGVALWVLGLNGFGRMGLFSSLLLGGGNRRFAEHVGAALRRTLPAYDIRTDLDEIPRPLRGQHPDNPVNLPRDGGVQIELPPRVRGSSPLWWDWEGPGLTPHTESLIDGLVQAVSTWA